MKRHKGDKLLKQSFVILLIAINSGCVLGVLTPFGTHTYEALEDVLRNEG